MKKVAKLVLKGLLVIVLFTGSSIALSTTGVKSVNEANAASYQQVYDYLKLRGYVVITLNPVSPDKGSNWIAHTVLNQVHYWTTVYVSPTGEIVGHTDVPM